MELLFRSVSLWVHISLHKDSEGLIRIVIETLAPKQVWWFTVSLKYIRVYNRCYI